MMTVWSVSTVVLTFVINVITTFFSHVTHTLKIISTTILAAQHTLCRFFRASSSFVRQMPAKRIL